MTLRLQFEPRLINGAVSPRHSGRPPQLLQTEVDRWFGLAKPGDRRSRTPLSLIVQTIAPRLCRFASEKLRLWCFGSRELASRLYRALLLPIGRERRAIAEAPPAYGVDRPAW